MPDSLIPPWSASPGAPAPSPSPGPVADSVALGIADADAWLAGGLRRDRLHEAYAATREDSPATTALALLVAWLNHRSDPRCDGRPIIWARALSGSGLPYGPGLAGLGIDPGIVTLLLLPDSRAVLRAGLDSVREGAAGGVMIELRGRQPLLDLTATRRLDLAAQDGGTMVWLVRAGAGPVPSAAQTRWQVAQAPADTGGRPTFDLTLLRCRGGREGLQLRMEWNRDTASFQSAGDRAGASLSGPVPALAAGGTGAAARGHHAA